MYPLTMKEYVQLQNDIKTVRTLKIIVQKSIFSLPIPIVVMGINSGCFPAIRRVFFINNNRLSFSAGYYSALIFLQFKEFELY